MKILVSTPAYNFQVNALMAKSLLEVDVFVQETGNIAIAWDTPVSSILPYSRNLSVFNALAGKFDWLLFWDADIEIKEKNFLLEILITSHKFNASIVGLPCKLKGGEVYNCATKVEDENGIMKYWNVKELGKEPMEVDVIGTGVMLIKTEILLDMKPPIFSFTDTVLPNGLPGFFPEDWNFCEKAKEKGHKIIADPRFTVVHWGMQGFK